MLIGGDNMLKIGQSISKTVVASNQIVQHIAKISGDINPVHLNEDYAKKSVFGNRIAHVLFCYNIISMIIGNYLPGNGTILVSHTFNYQKPIFSGDSIKTVVSVKNILSEGK